MVAVLNFLQVSERVGTAGQPTAEQFADIKAAGYEVVLNLAMPDSTNALPNEAKLVREQDMDYVHIPVVWDDPQDDDLDRFFDVMDRVQERKVFVHCALNWRVSSFIYLYRIIHQGVAMEAARQTLHEVWTPDPVWQSFIEKSLIRHGVSI
jgi:protein tyrosine phosphatase (PTP) superfamily phosphohydrolase (DUF442 family)